MSKIKDYMLDHPGEVIGASKSVKDPYKVKECKLGHICTSGCQNDFDCPCLSEHDCMDEK